MSVRPPRFAFPRALLRSETAVAMLEFALILPLFLGFVLSGIEMCNYVMANNRVQRLAAMSADLVAQSGSGQIGTNESQIYDLFSALDVSARPFDLRDHGRIVITGVKGTDKDGDGKVEDRMLWQRFDGTYVAAAPLLGCAQETDIAKLPGDRVLPLNEILFHVQVSYEYQPIFSVQPFHWLDLPTDFTRTAMFRARSSDFQTPTPQPDKFPPKNKCNSPNGL